MSDPVFTGAGGTLPRPRAPRNQNPFDAALIAAAVRDWKPSPGCTVSPFDFLEHARLLDEGKPGLAHVQARMDECEGRTQLSSEELAAASRGHRPRVPVKVEHQFPEPYVKDYVLNVHRLTEKVDKLLDRRRARAARREADRMLAAMEARTWLPCREGEFELTHLVFPAEGDLDKLAQRIAYVAEYRVGIGWGNTAQHGAVTVEPRASAPNAAPEPLEAAPEVLDELAASETPTLMTRARADRGSRLSDRLSPDRKVEGDKRDLDRDLDQRARTRTSSAPGVAAAPPPKADERRYHQQALHRGASLAAKVAEARRLARPLRVEALEGLSPEARRLASTWVGLYLAHRAITGDPVGVFYAPATAKALGASEATVRELWSWTHANRSRLFVGGSDAFAKRGYSVDLERLEELTASELQTSA